MADTPPVWLLVTMWIVTTLATISWLTVAAFDYNILTDPLGLAGDLKNLVFIVVGTIGMIELVLTASTVVDNL